MQVFAEAVQLFIFLDVQFPLLTYLDNDSFTMCLSLMAPGLSTRFHIPHPHLLSPSPTPFPPQNMQRYLKIEETPETKFFQLCTKDTPPNPRRVCLNFTHHDCGSLSVTLFRICDHATKNETHLSSDVNEILVHVYIHLYIHWGRFDNAHGSITGEALIPVCTPIFKQYSPFPLCQRH